MLFSERYRPLYFLSATGAGGLSVAFFTYLLFLTKHPHSALPTFDALQQLYATGPMPVQVIVTIDLVVIAVLALVHAVLMVANLRAYGRFRRTDDYLELRRSNAEVTLMALPLALAMSVNVVFVVAALAVPGLWNVVEYLLPLAIVAYLLIGALSFRTFGRYLTRILGHQGFDHTDNNHFNQMLPSFTFSMVAVGLAAPAAMSHVLLTSTIAMLGAFLFGSAALLWAAVKLPVSFSQMLRNGMAPEAGPTLWIGIPVTTLLGIAFVRVGSGVSHQFFDVEMPAPLTFIVLGMLVSVQIALGLLGFGVMRSQGYFKRFLWGPERSIASYGLICPGVAFSVLMMFFLQWGLVNTDVVESLSWPHLVTLGLPLAFQVVFTVIFIQLNRKLLGRGGASESVEESKPELAEV